NTSGCRSSPRPPESNFPTGLKYGSHVKFRNVTARVYKIYRVSTAIDVRMLVKIGIPGDEPSDLGIIIPGSHLHQPRIALRPVTARRSEHVGIGAAAGTRHGLPEPIERQRACHRLAAVGHRPLAAQPVEQRVLTVFPQERVAIGVGRCGGSSLLLQQHTAPAELERRCRSSCRSADPAAYGVVG